MSEFVPSVQVNGRSFELFISNEQIKRRTAEIAQELNARFAGQFPIMLPVLTGAYYFASLLFSQLTFPYAVDFVKISSYGKKMKSTGEPILMLKHQLELINRPVIIIEDVIETGITADFLYEHLHTYQPKSVEIITLLFKPTKFEGKTQPKTIGFEIGEEFVVGLGMDYAEDGRYLSDIYRLKA